MKKLSLIYLVLGAIVLCSGTVASATDVKERMTARKPQIQALKDKSLIGEDAFGKLAFVTANKEGEAIVKAENIDRNMVYTVIAKQQSTTTSLVGRRRAKQLAGIAKKGEYLKKEDGTWYKKP